MKEKGVNRFEQLHAAARNYIVRTTSQLICFEARSILAGYYNNLFTFHTPWNKLRNFHMLLLRFARFEHGFALCPVTYRNAARSGLMEIFPPNNLIIYAHYIQYRPEVSLHLCFYTFV